MGFFSGVRRRIKKLIPKEVRPFIPYAAAMIPGMAALGPIGGAFTKASLARLATDDEADLKDALRAGALAAAPAAINKGVASLAGTTNAAGDPTAIANFLNKGREVGDTGKTMSLARSIEGKLNPSGIMGQAKMIGAQGAVDYSIKAAELNKDALERYNADLLKQGIDDKAGRRAAIRAIYSNTGTWDMDEVDSMLDTYGYRTGGRVGYAEGDMVLPMPSQLSPERENQIRGNQMAEQAYNEIFEKFMNKFPGLATGEETLEEMIAMLQAENVMNTENLGILGLDKSMDMITPESVRNSTRRIMVGDTQYGDIGSMGPDEDVGDYGQAISRKNGGRIGLKDGGFDMEAFEEGFKYAKEGLESLEEAEDEIKPLPIRELRLAKGGRVEELKEHYRRYLEMARKDGSKKIIPFEIFAEEFARENFARGGDVMDMNMEEQIDTPSGDMMMDENVEVASNPEVMDSLNELSLMLFRRPLDQLSEDEYEELKDFAGQTALKPGLIDEYRNYKMGQEDAGQPVLSPRDYFEMEFGAARMGVKKGGKVIKFRPKEIKVFGKSKDYPGIKEIIRRSKLRDKQRSGKAEGGLMNLGGKEMDLRGGGFVPMGAKERADDVPARLSKNEFVMTADAVRGAGGGSVQKGADLMYDQMKTLEAKA